MVAFFPYACCDLSLPPNAQTRNFLRFKMAANKLDHHLVCSDEKGSDISGVEGRSSSRQTKLSGPATYMYKSTFVYLAHLTTFDPFLTPSPSSRFGMSYFFAFWGLANLFKATFCSFCCRTKVSPGSFRVFTLSLLKKY